MKQPSEKAVNAAAQLWCQPQHEKKEMDPDFAISIAHALDAFAAEAVKAEREGILRIARGQQKLAEKASRNWRALARSGWHTARALAFEWIVAAIRARGKE